MKSAVETEFQTVDLILSCNASTSKVDAFCLTWIKFEKQLRMLTANILYQGSMFAESDDSSRQAIRAALVKRNNIKHDHFIGGIRRLTGQPMNTIIGDRYKYLKREIEQAYGFRQKIFHGQQTGKNLKARDLAMSQARVREWCEILAREGAVRFGYDGFSRNSLQKNHRNDVTTAVDNALQYGDWKEFVAKL
jgi:hypothetical protein